LEGESYSIGNQKKLLTKAAKDKGYTTLLTFADDGISGVTMNRPGYKAMIEEIEKGTASAVFVKDMSRLGRNYIEVGRLTEEFFPEHDIRLVAVSDGVDTAEGENDLTPIRNLFNKHPLVSKENNKPKRCGRREIPTPLKTTTVIPISGITVLFKYTTLPITEEKMTKPKRGTDSSKSIQSACKPTVRFSPLQIAGRERQRQG
jgi:hypothetical protein